MLVMVVNRWRGEERMAMGAGAYVSRRMTAEGREMGWKRPYLATEETAGQQRQQPSAGETSSPRDAGDRALEVIQ